jgi:hypothetical protein
MHMHARTQRGDSYAGTDGGEYDNDVQLGEIKGGENNNEDEQDEMKM